MLEDAVLSLKAGQLDDSSDTPLYQQIYTLIRNEITSGQIQPHSRLPAEQDLVQRLGVSRITVKRAFNELAVSGLVTRHRGRGTIVTFDAAAPTVKGSFENLFEGLKRMGLETQVRLISCDNIRVEPDLAESLELPPE